MFLCQAKREKYNWFICVKLLMAIWKFLHLLYQSAIKYDRGEMKVYGGFVFKISPKINEQKYFAYLGITVLVRWLN